MTGLPDNFLDIYEYALPVISVDISEINIEASDDYKGVFNIKNVGGGLLCGSIASSSLRFIFSPDRFECNYQNVEFLVDLKNLFDVDSIACSIIIQSNGGEKIIPVSIKVTANTFYSKGGYKISSLDQFFNFAAGDHSDAVDVFVTEKFKHWIKKISPGYCSIFNQLLLDENKDRALDNFLRIVFNKDFPDIEIETEYMEFFLKANDSKLLFGHLVVKKTDFFYVSLEINSLHEVGWFSLNTSFVDNSDFDENFEAVVSFVIDPLKIIGKTVKNKIAIESEFSSKLVNIVVHKQPIVNAFLSKESFYFSDHGEVVIENNTQEVLEITLLPKDSYIRFEAKKYFVREIARIPFQIKYPMGAFALLSAKSKQNQISEISVKFTYAKQFFRMRLKVLIGHGQ